MGHALKGGAPVGTGNRRAEPRGRQRFHAVRKGDIAGVLEKRSTVPTVIVRLDPWMLTPAKSGGPSDRTKKFHWWCECRGIRFAPADETSPNILEAQAECWAALEQLMFRTDVLDYWFPVDGGRVSFGERIHRDRDTFVRQSPNAPVPKDAPARVRKAVHQSRDERAADECRQWLETLTEEQRDQFTLRELAEFPR